MYDNLQKVCYVLKRTVLCMIVCALTALPAQAVPITDLFNTGVVGVTNSATSLQGPGLPDPHYTLAGPVGTLLPAVVTPPGYPFPAWVANTLSSQWIGPNRADSRGPGGDYIYETTFTLPANADLNTVLIAGDWATDNTGLDIRINGTPTSNFNSIQFPRFTPFSITAPPVGTSPFSHGTNTLEFLVRNLDSGGGPTGLHIGSLRGAYQIPEPASVGLLVLGVCGISGFALRRRRRP